MSINIEKAVLSTIILEIDKNEKIIENLKSNDFTHTFHKVLFDAILKLNEKDMPIDEDFLKKEMDTRFDEALFFDIVATTPIVNIDAYIKEIKENSKKVKMKEIISKINKNIDDAKVDNLINYFETELENLQKSDVSSQDEDISLFDMIDKELKTTVIYSTGLKFLDDILGGGFEMGQLVTITGEQEAGKTQLVNQILFNVASGFKCLYFSLEFNKRQLIEYTKHKIKKCNIDKNRFKNIIVMTDEMTTGNIDDVIITIKQKYRKHNTKFVVIDSQMMLYEDDENSKYATSEEKISSIFRKLHNLSKKLDICILLIAQSSKEDNKSRKIEIFGSKKAAHLARIMIHINYNREEDIKNNDGKREIFIAKNKQNGKLAKIDVFFDRERLEFTTMKNTTKEKIENNTEEKTRSALELIL